MSGAQPSYRGLPDDHRAARISAEVRLITIAKRAGRDVSEHRCAICGGIVTITLKRMPSGAQHGSRGTCATENCLEWDE